MMNAQQTEEACRKIRDDNLKDWSLHLAADELAHEFREYLEDRYPTASLTPLQRKRLMEAAYDLGEERKGFQGIEDAYARLSQFATLLLNEGV